MSQRYYAKGKLLLTSEYVILNGAKALAVPLKKGQSLICTKKNEQGVLSWKAEYAGKSWFETSIKLADNSIIQSTSTEKTLRLIKLLHYCQILNPDFAGELNTWDIRTELEFNPDWGFGSSSTLISLLAQWAAIDPMQLYFMAANGSGYDIACASANSAIIYQLKNGEPRIDPVEFYPGFADNLWLVYLGNKQDTEVSVARFQEKLSTKLIDSSFFSTLTEDIINSQTINEFGSLLIEHEKKIAKLLSLPLLGELFDDFDGYVKSLGAWGGDFALFASDRDGTYIREYLKRHRKDIFFSYKELVFNEAI